LEVALLWLLADEKWGECSGKNDDFNETMMENDGTWMGNDGKIMENDG